MRRLAAWLCCIAHDRHALSPRISMLSLAMARLGTPILAGSLAVLSGLVLMVAEEARLGRALNRPEWPEALERVVDMPPWVERLVAERLVATVARALVDRFERMYGLLRAFSEREGRANVPSGHVESGENLGIWLQSQRQLHRAGRLQQSRSARLEAVGVVWDVLAEQWGRGYAALVSFREREGHAKVPKSHVEGEVRLGGWLQRQRQRMQARGLSEAERKAKRVSALSDKEVSRLEAVGVVL